MQQSTNCQINNKVTKSSKCLNNSQNRKNKILRRKKQQQLQEYQRLRELIPSVSSVPSHLKVSKVTIINEAVKYIDELHSKVVERLSQGTLPTNLLSNNLFENTNDIDEIMKNQFTSDESNFDVPNVDQLNLQDAFNCLLSRLSCPLTTRTTSPQPQSPPVTVNIECNAPPA